MIIKDNKIDVLNHGFVRLYKYMGSDLDVVRSARVSYDAAERTGEDSGSDNRLIRYLWKHHHTSPFESVVFTFDVKAPIFVIRQWQRHRTMSYNEMSGRYTQMPEEYYIPDHDMVGAQSESNKQGRELIEGRGIAEAHQRRLEVGVVDSHMKSCFRLYNELLESDWPRELARTVLPLSTYSHMFCTVNLLNLFKFLTLRNDASAQYEIQIYANAMLELIKPIVPVCVSAYESSIAK